MASNILQMGGTKAATSSGQGAINPHHRKQAVHHATLLQQRKDIEADILAALEELIEYPTESTSIAAKPMKTDLLSFNKLISPFQISDYDSLIEERNAAEKCGYVFCNKLLQRSPGPRELLRIVRGSANDRELKVVPNSKYEMWCGKWCARRALYIKYQLSEVPAWERAGGLGNSVTPLDDVNGFDDLRERMEKMSLEKRQEEEIQQALAELALERGERAESKALLPAMIVQENESLGVAKPPQLGDDVAGREIEGYAPKSTVSINGFVTASEEEHDTDWHI